MFLWDCEMTTGFFLYQAFHIIILSCSGFLRFARLLAYISVLFKLFVMWENTMKRCNFVSNNVSIQNLFTFLTLNPFGNFFQSDYNYSPFQKSSKQSPMKIIVKKILLLHFASKLPNRFFFRYDFKTLSYPFHFFNLEFFWHSFS